MSHTIKEIVVGAKKSFNFQTYEVAFVADVSFIQESEVEESVRQLQAKARKMCQEQINIDRGIKPVVNSTDFI